MIRCFILISLEQRLTDIPAKVYQKLEVQLSDGESDCKTLACQIFPNIRQQEIEYLTTRCPTNKAKGIFKKMSEKGITVGQLVDALKFIERQDAIETLIEAGYPGEPDTIGNSIDIIIIINESWSSLFIGVNRAYIDV